MSLPQSAFRNPPVLNKVLVNTCCQEYCCHIDERTGEQIEAPKSVCYMNGNIYYDDNPVFGERVNIHDNE